MTTWPSHSFPLVRWVVASAALLALGAILIKRGFWPRRRGDEPHCRSCGYLLIGIDSQRCPECGGMISLLGIVRGQRNRRLGPTLLGFATILLSLTILGWLATGLPAKIDWYHVKPTFMVMRDLRTLPPAMAVVEMRELMRRDKAGELSTRYQRQLVEMGLAQQAGTDMQTLTEPLIVYLQRQYLAGHLTDAQKMQFERRCVALSLRVRPIIVLGDRVPYEITANSHVAITGSPTRVQVLYVGINDEIDGQETPWPAGDSMNCLDYLGDWGRSRSAIECKSVGKHQLQVTVHVELYRDYESNTNNTNVKNLLFQEDRKLTGSFEVVAQPRPGDFKLIDDPKLGDQIKASTHPDSFFLDPKSANLHGSISFLHVPANIAFDVVARANGCEYNLGSIVCNKDDVAYWYIGGTLSGTGATMEPSAFDLILRSNEKTARETLDQHDIWKGELIYPNLPISITQAQ